MSTGADADDSIFDVRSVQSVVAAVVEAVVVSVELAPLGPGAGSYRGQP